MDSTQSPTQQPPQTPVNIPDFQPKPNYLKTIIFSVLVIITLSLISYLIFQNKQLKIEAKVTNFRECSVVKGSLTQFSYPAVCVLPSGKTFTQELTNEKKSILVPPKETRPTISISSSPDETAEWKTYVNTKYRFSLKSPNQLEEINIDGSVTASNKTYLTKQFTSDVVVRIIYGWTEEKVNPYNQTNKLSAQIISGIKWYLSFTENANEPGCYSARSQTLTSDQKNTIEISIYECPNDSKLEKLSYKLDQILSTFKFL